jgi:hypothetical protein
MSSYDPTDRDDLPSAYVDGALSEEDRARVEADAELRAAAQQVGRLRELLRDVPAQPATEAATHLAAALAVFDAERSLAPAPTPVPSSDAAAAPAPVTPLPSRRTTAVATLERLRRRWVPALGVAAATVAALGIGLQALSRDGEGGGDDLATIEATTAEADVMAGSTVAGGDAAVASDGARADEGGKQSSGGAAETTSATLDAGAISGIDGPATPATTVPAAPTADTVTPLPAGLPGVEVLGTAESGDDLARLGADGLARVADGTIVPPAASPCPDLGTLVGSVTWRGSTALVVVDESARRVLAVELATCQVLESVDLP